MEKFPEDPFGFRDIENKDDPEPEELTPSLRAKNTPVNEAAAEDAVSGQMTNVIKLYRQAMESLDKRNRKTETAVGDGTGKHAIEVDSRKIYDPDSPVTDLREELVVLVGASAEFEAIKASHDNGTTIPEIDPVRLGQMERMLATALRDDLGNMVCTVVPEDELDAYYETSSLKPDIDSLGELYSNARHRLARTTTKALNSLDMLPEAVKITEEGGIISATLSLSLDPEELPPEVYSDLSGATSLELVYKFRKDTAGDEEPNYSYYGLRGIVGEDIEVDEIELTDHGVR